ncbi:MAG: RsmB/NOP family class I SAM-dependent RNA methyltransferase [Betaproteobacteria bacterium]|nr:RsmB/NOP family class I SAM-dependent RNA methyltransferase [Betaproteobacteria bacterium]
MPIHRHQLDAATEALRLALKFDRPADVVLHQFFREQRALGSHDRAFVAESVFGVLRRKRLIDHLVRDATPRRMLLAYLTRVTGVSARELAPALRPDEVETVGSIKAVALDELPLAVKAELPDWLVERLRANMPEAEILALGRALQQPAPLDLRVNTVRAERGAVLAELAAGGITAEPTPYSPVGIRLKDKPAINRHPLFTTGAIEVQDEGSQLLAYLVAPKRRELVVDFCAGAGGKALMLGALMQSHGRVYAFDISEKRLARLKPRLKRSGLSNLYPYVIRNENDIKVKRLAAKIDRVLVDAPCSGLGTLRRNPDLKWRQSPATVEELKRKQAAILSAAAALLKPGGRLVYATCSLLAEENQEIVAGFRAAHQRFSILHCGEILRHQRIELDTGPYLQLWPHVHGTDGFFAAALMRSD